MPSIRDATTRVDQLGLTNVVWAAANNWRPSSAGGVPVPMGCDPDPSHLDHATSGGAVLIDIERLWMGTG